jgi:hypothetical protein
VRGTSLRPSYSYLALLIVIRNRRQASVDALGRLRLAVRHVNVAVRRHELDEILAIDAGRAY